MWVHWSILTIAEIIAYASCYWSVSENQDKNHMVCIRENGDFTRHNTLLRFLIIRLCQHRPIVWVFYNALIFDSQLLPFIYYLYRIWANTVNQRNENTAALQYYIRHFRRTLNISKCCGSDQAWIFGMFFSHGGTGRRAAGLFGAVG